MDLVQSDLGAYFMRMGVSFQGWEDEPVWFIDSEQLQEYNFVLRSISYQLMKACNQDLSGQH